MPESDFNCCNDIGFPKTHQGPQQEVNQLKRHITSVITGRRLDSAMVLGRASCQSLQCHVLWRPSHCQMYVFQFIVTIVRMKVLTWYGREYPLAPKPSRLYTPLHHSCRLQHGAAWTSMRGTGGTVLMMLRQKLGGQLVIGSH
jgi:hypothetical protein